jgi:hypothetical protein
VLLEREIQRLRAARAGAETEPAEWRDAVAVNQAQVWVTAEEAAALSAAMVELFLTHAERITDPESRPAGARLVSLVGWLAPSGPQRSEP